MTDFITPKKNPLRSLLLLFLATCLIFLVIQSSAAHPATPDTSLPILWTAGGLDPGNTGAGQAAHMAIDTFGNVAIVSGPALGTHLAVTSYTADGTFRWQRTVSPTSGTFVGDWVAPAPDGDVVAVGHNTNANGDPIGITMVRYDTDGNLSWRVDISRTLPSIGRLLVDATGNTYLAFNAIGDGQDIELHKYDLDGNLLWSEEIATGLLSNDIATSLAFGPDESDVVLSGDISGGADWITASYSSTTGASNWLVVAPEGVAARDLVVDDTHVYVTGMGNQGITEFLTVVAYDRATGAQAWRTDTMPNDATGAMGLRISKAPDGSLVVAGRATRGFLDWYTVAFETSGTIRWDAVRDGGLNTDEVPAGVFVLPDGIAVVTGPGGPNLPGGYIPGVTVGYSPDGVLMWDAFSNQATVWGTALLTGDICATGGYDALITCWQVPPYSPTSTPTNTPVTPSPTPTNTPSVTVTPSPTITQTPTPSPTTLPDENIIFIPILMRP